MSAERTMQHVAKRPRTSKGQDALFVSINREASIDDERSRLPVCMQEQEIVEAFREDDVVILTGATGSGKTTQVPQFLIENGYGDPDSASRSGLVAVTQPRRIAAISCASRVSTEVSSPLGEMIGYHVRHKSAFCRNTRVNFMTDGILLREIQDDLFLRQYSAVVIDEAHERTLNTDILLALLSRTVILRRQCSSAHRDMPDSKADTYQPLKLIIMSATLDIDGVFAGQGSLFPFSRVVNVPARQYPVTVHFARQTNVNYEQEAFRKVLQIHQELPPGGILVFLTGYREVTNLVHRLRTSLRGKCEVLPFFAMLEDSVQKKVFCEYKGKRKVIVATNVAETSVTIPGISYVVDSGRVKEKVFHSVEALNQVSHRIVWTSKASAEQRAGRAGRLGPGHCYRLYSSAVYDREFRQFRTAEIVRVPADSIVLRLRCMGIRHVHKFPFPTKPDMAAIETAEKLLCTLGALEQDSSTGSLQRARVSHANDRRAAAVHVVPSVPTLGVTQIGYALSRIPLPPRYGRMLLASLDVDGLMPYAARAAALLSVGEIFDRTVSNWRQLREPFCHPLSDVLTALRALCAVEYAGYFARTNSSNRDHDRSDDNGGAVAEKDGIQTTCCQYAINYKTCVEALSIAHQLERHMTTFTTFRSAVDGAGGSLDGQMIYAGSRSRSTKDSNRAARSVDDCEDDNMEEEEEEENEGEDECQSGVSRLHCRRLSPMSDAQDVGLIRSLLCGFPDYVARRLSREDARLHGCSKNLEARAFATSTESVLVYVKSESSLEIGDDVEYVCFTELAEVTTPHGIDTTRDVLEDVSHEGDTCTDDDDCDEEDDSADCVNENPRSDDVFEYNDGTQPKRFNVSSDCFAKKRRKLVISGVSILQSKWIADDCTAMCKFKTQESRHRARYDSRRDCVLRLERVFYGNKSWPIGTVWLPFQVDSPEHLRAACTAFGLSLLCGEVLEGLCCGLPKPALENRLGVLVATLYARRVHSRAQLIAEWLSEAGRPCFGRDEYLKCTPASDRKRVLAAWKDVMTRLCQEVQAD